MTRLILVLILLVGAAIASFQVQRMRNPSDREQTIATLCAELARTRLGIDASVRLADDVLDDIERLPDVDGEPIRYRFQSTVEYPTTSGGLITTGVLCDAHLEGFMRENVVDRVQVGNQFR